MRLHDLKPNPGAKHRRKRLGIGESSGKGKTSGKGTKGAGARVGGPYWKPGHEGGQTPLFRRMPKRGFNNARFQHRPAVVNVGDTTLLALSVPGALLPSELASCDQA